MDVERGARYTMTHNYLELYHHGILGQKWGVRRFQNRDGSYTAKGKDRHNKQVSGESKPSTFRKAQHIADRVTIAKSKSKPGTTDTYDRATKGPMGSKKSRRMADMESRNGINGSHSSKYNEGKKVREAEKREREYNKNSTAKTIVKGVIVDRAIAIAGGLSTVAVSAKLASSGHNAAAISMNKIGANTIKVGRAANAIGTIKKVVDNKPKKTQPTVWDEKPNTKTPWDEKPSKKQSGRI